MYQYEDLFGLVFDNLKRIVFPEEWLAIDIEMSKQELFTIMMIDRFGEITMAGNRLRRFINRNIHGNSRCGFNV